MRKERKNLPLASILPNLGQLDWLPKNPRQWTKGDIDRTAVSIREDPDFLDDRPLLVVPFGDETFIVFAGNLRREGGISAPLASAPSVVYFPETAEDFETIKRRAIKDNGSFGSWDFDELANSWDDLPLVDWGVPAWEGEHEKKMQQGLSSEGREGAEGYEEFVNKFNEEQPLTTDDCYTPPEVYDIIRDFVDKNIAPLKGRKIVRPFYPGGDYENEKYPKGCIVLDNPPFSIYAKIVRYYCERGIDFFLFGPQLSLFVQGADVCFLPENAVITYENGAKVNTGFVTNLLPGIRIKCIPGLKAAILEAQRQEPTTPVYEYPAEIISSALLGKIGSNADLEILSTEAQYVHNLDAFKEMDKGLFGGGFLLSRAAAEKARAAAEKARAVKIALSEKELAIVSALDGANR